MKRKQAPSVVKLFAIKRGYIVTAICLMFTFGISLPAGGFSLLVAQPPCPAPGSGAAGVAAFGALCTSPCDNPATTCNGDFTIQLLPVQRNGSLVTFTYMVCNIGGPPAISHFVVGLAQIDCLAAGNILDDLITSCSRNGNTLDNCVVGLDPTTQLVGIKFDTGGAGEAGSCELLSFTLDESKLDPGFEIGEGCVVGAAKAGNQDITRADRESPGYACMVGPVCRTRGSGEEENEGCTPGYWKNHLASWGPTGLSPNQAINTLFNMCNGSLGSKSLIEGLSFKGGSTLDGAKQILLRAAIAAALNAAHPDVNYPRSLADIQAAVNAACASGSRSTILSLAEALDSDNNLGCPLN